MRKLSFLILLIIGAFSLNAQNGWVNTNFNSTYAGTNDVLDIHFMNQDSGVVITDNGANSRVWITEDGGQTWSYDTLFSGLTTIFANPSAMYMAGDNGILIKATLGSNGLNYTSLSSSTTDDIYDVHFPTSSTGYVVGESGAIRKTTNGGTSWSNPVVSGLYYDFHGVFFTSASNGFVVGSYNTFQGFINRTVSGGSYWGSPTITPSKMNDVYFPESTTGYAVGNGGIVYKSTNGTSFSSITSGTSNNLNAVYFLNADTGFIVGNSGTILKTLDGGSNWIDQSLSTSKNINSISMLDFNNAYLALDSNTVMKTQTSGVSLNLTTYDDSVYCNGYANLQINTTYNGTGTLSYTWNSSPNLSNLNIASPTAGPLSATETFYVSVTDGNITVNDSLTVSVIPLPTDSICLVTVDDSLGHNLVIFEKRQSGPIEYYKIYRETSVTNVYDSIGMIPADSFGYFVDTASNPAVRAYRYKISNVDSCGNESVLSDNHQTMHLSINQGVGTSWNLIWTQYEGIQVQTYRIWRADTSGNYTLIDSVSGSNTSYTDMNPPLGGLYYQVEVVTGFTCKPFNNYKVNTNYNSSRSNTADNGMINPVPLVAGFTANTTSGNYPLTVSFTDQTSGGPMNWYWEFGDGNTDTVQNPTHVYASMGTYSVMLVVGNMSGYDTIIKTDYIDANNVGINETGEAEIEVYPNPMTENSVFIIEAKNIIIDNILITDLLGKQIDFEISEINNNKIELLADFKSKGIYLLQISDDKGNKLVKKLIIK